VVAGLDDRLAEAKLAPRRTMPRTAIISGTNRVGVIEACASGNDVRSTTKVKINQTWLASHAGPIERGQLGSVPSCAPPRQWH
jgi:hypothetical protein